MQPAPKISVIVPTYNRAHLITRCLESIRAQTLKPFEVIIVDDCSKDNTEEIVSNISIGIPVIYKKSPKNAGGGVARNTGVALSSGSLIAFLDSDDEWQPDHLRLLVEQAERLNGEFAISSSIIFTRNGRVMPKRMFPVGADIRAKQHYILTSGFAFQTSTLLLSRPTALKFHFNPRLRRHQDWDLVFRMIQQGITLVQVRTPTIKYHQEAGVNVSGSKSLTPSLRFLALHKRTMSRRSIARFRALEIDRRKPDHLRAIFSLFSTFCIGGIGLKEFLYFIKIRLMR